MRSEIGSEFWSVERSFKENHTFPSTAQWFMSGRSALSFILREIRRRKDVRTAALPSWCCESMIRPFLNAGLDVTFYPVVVEDGRLFQYPSDDCDILFVMDYFGFDSSMDHSNSKSVVIRDVTHSLFTRIHRDADYYFGSLRKWTGVLTGGFAWGDRLAERPVCGPELGYVDLRQRAMSEKAEYIAGKQDDKDFLNLFSLAEEKLDRENMICGAAPGDVEAAQHLDAAFIRQRRRENAGVLLERLSEYALFKELGEDDCPLFVPILIKDRDGLKQYLIHNGIFCPYHWPLSQLHSVSNVESRLYQEELSLVCDQRYSIEDMQRIASKVIGFYRQGVHTC